MGSFRLSAGRLHHHKHFNFAESREETVWPSLRHSCRSELTRQGISLPWDRYSYGRRLPGLRSRACTPSLNLPAPGRRHTLYVHLTCLQSAVFLLNSRGSRFAATASGSTSKSLHPTAAHLIPKLRCQFAEFLHPSSLKRLRMLIAPTCVRLRYGRLK